MKKDMSIDTKQTQSTSADRFIQDCIQRHTITPRKAARVIIKDMCETLYKMLFDELTVSSYLSQTITVMGIALFIGLPNILGLGKFFYANSYLPINIILLSILLFLNSKLWLLMSNRQYTFGGILATSFGFIAWSLDDIYPYENIEHSIIIKLLLLLVQTILYYMIAQVKITIENELAYREFEDEQERVELVFRNMLETEDIEFDIDSYNKAKKKYNLNLPEFEIS